MDTKWKKWKIVVSFLAFFIGITLFIGNFFAVGVLLLGSEGEVLEERRDYQDSAEFRGYVASLLEELLGVATGGKGWRIYGVTMEDGYYSGYSSRSTWLYGGTATSSVTVVADDYVWTDSSSSETAEGVEETPMEPAGEGSTPRTDVLYGEEPFGWYADGKPQTADEHMADMAHNKNIRYAVIYQDKLLYTNIDAFADKMGGPWEGENFYETLSAEEYNFSLWYNRNKDGKVEILKDNKLENVYGNGVYTSGSRWYVPGYTNFVVDDSAKEAVIFIAVAKEPKLYVVGDYAEFGTKEYGSYLQYLQYRTLAIRRDFEINCVLLGIAVFLLFVSFCMRKGKRQADKAIAAFLGKIWLGVKCTLGIGAVVVLVVVGYECIDELIWQIYRFGRRGFFQFDWDMDYGLQIGVFLAGVFWLVYLIVLDRRYNKGKQKMPLLSTFRMSGAKYATEKKAVWRYRVLFITGIVIPCCLAVVALMYSYDDFFGIVMVLLIFLVVGINIFLARKNRQLIGDACTLMDGIKDVREGNLKEGVKTPADTELADAFENLSEIRHGMETALEEQMQSERMKVELVTNVSHDIKTPLTSIVSYVELLRQEEGLSAQAQEYVRILGEKSERLKDIVQDVFEISKAASGQLPLTVESLDMGKLLRQTLADMDGQIEASGLTMKMTVPAHPVPVCADGQRLYRIFQNLLQNALQYSMKGSRVFLTLSEDGETATVKIQNISDQELSETTDFTERFVRGDVSRTDGGSGLGLSIAKSFTEACGGSFAVEINADLFTVTVAFPKEKLPEESQPEVGELPVERQREVL